MKHRWCEWCNITSTKWINEMLQIFRTCLTVTVLMRPPPLAQVHPERLKISPQISPSEHGDISHHCLLFTIRAAKKTGNTFIIDGETVNKSILIHFAHQITTNLMHKVLYCFLLPCGVHHYNIYTYIYTYIGFLNFLNKKRHSKCKCTLCLFRYSS